MTCVQPEGPVPLVVVEGFLSSTSAATWGRFADHLEIGRGVGAAGDATGFGAPSRLHLSSLQRQQVVFAPVGPLSSIHDRACELFHALRGTRVDYGHHHASQHGHSRYGRKFTRPLLPGWGDKTDDGQHFIKAHFLGHSLGGLSVLALYDLLRAGFFNSSLGLPPDSRQAGQLVLSLTTISSPHRGTPLVYLLGSEPTSIPLVRFLSPGDCLAKFVHLLIWARRLPFAQNRFFNLDDWLPDFMPDAWHFAGNSAVETCTGLQEYQAGRVAQWNCDSCPSPNSSDGQDAKDSGPWKASETFGLYSLLSQWQKSAWAEGRDCAPWDCTFAQRQSQEDVEGGIWSSSHDSGPVWLRSYATSTSKANSKSLIPPSPWSESLSHYDYSCSPPPGSRRTGHYHVDSGYTSATEATPRTTTKRAKGGEKISNDWYLNDGIVPLASQYHPDDCRSGYCQHEQWQHESKAASIHQTPSPAPRLLSLTTFCSMAQWLRSMVQPCQASQPPRTAFVKPMSPPASNLWHVSTLDDTTHAGLAPFYTGSHKQMVFWQHVGSWLHAVEQAASLHFP